MDLLSLLKKDLKERYKKPGNVYLGLVHRLDRPVGGVILFAKTSKAASRMSNLLRKRELVRTYLAICRGIIKKKQERLIHYLYKDRKRNHVSVVQANTHEAKKAILDYEVIGKKHGLSFLKVHLKTGRSHQIRVQLSEIGHPLYGDQRYGKDVNKVGQQIALWANKLSFVHPVRNTRITIESNPPIEYPWDIWIPIKK